MNKKVTLYLISIFSAVLLAIFSLLIFYGVFSFFKKTEPSKTVNIVDLVLLDSEYKNQAKPIVDNFWSLLQDNQLTAEKTLAIKNQLMNLKVTRDLAEIHFSLVFAMDKMIIYFNSQDESYRLAAEELIRKVEENDFWLK